MFTSTPPICTGRALELSRKDSNIRYLRHLRNLEIAKSSGVASSTCRERAHPIQSQLSCKTPIAPADVIRHGALLRVYCYRSARHHIVWLPSRPFPLLQRRAGPTHSVLVASSVPHDSSALRSELESKVNRSRFPSELPVIFHRKECWQMQCSGEATKHHPNRQLPKSTDRNGRRHSLVLPMCTKNNHRDNS